MRQETVKQSFHSGHKSEVCRTTFKLAPYIISDIQGSPTMSKAILSNSSNAKNHIRIILKEWRRMKPILQSDIDIKKQAY